MAEESPCIVFCSSGPVYRIPSIFYESESKTLLAFAEEREAKEDHMAKRLVMRRGVLKEISPDKKEVEWSPVQSVETACMAGHRSMNPCPLYDRKTNKLFLFYICVEGNITEGWQIRTSQNKARLCYITSNDLGMNWSSAVDLTNKLPEVRDWSTFAVGPGHGLQISSGRLIVPFYAYAKGGKPSRACSLYSDNSGVEWKFGKMFDSNSCECEMVEFFNDKDESVVYCNARSVDGHRVEEFSFDTGECFQPREDQTLVETDRGCQGSVVSFPVQDQEECSGADPKKKTNKWLLFTHPNHDKKRVDLAVYLNKNPSSGSWSKPWIINYGPSGYSDLAYVDDGWFVCLMECGKQSISETIACKVFNYSQVEQGIAK